MTYVGWRRDLDKSTPIDHDLSGGQLPRPAWQRRQPRRNRKNLVLSKEMIRYTLFSLSLSLFFFFFYTALNNNGISFPSVFSCQALDSHSYTVSSTLFPLLSIVVPFSSLFFLSFFPFFVFLFLFAFFLFFFFFIVFCFLTMPFLILSSASLYFYLLLLLTTFFSFSFSLSFFFFVILFCVLVFPFLIFSSASLYF